MTRRLLLILLVFLLASCFNEDDYDIQEVRVTPTMAIPIAFGDMGLVDLLANSDTSFIRSYPDGLLYLYYNSTLPSRDIRDMFDIQDNNSTIAFPLPAGVMNASSVDTPFGTINGQIDFDLDPASLTELVMKTGILNHSLLLSKTTSPPNLPMQATVTFDQVIHKTTGQPLVLTIGNGTFSASLADYVFTLADNAFDVRVDLVIKPHPATFIPVDTDANVFLGFNELVFATIEGFFGDRITPLPPQAIDITVFSSSLKDATVNFVEPKISLRAVSDYGVPCEVSFSVLRARKDAGTLPLQLSPASPITINAPGSLGNSATTNVNITNQEAVFNFAPTQLEYTASARINKSLSTGTNFMADTSMLRISLITEVPLYGRVSGITVMDTLEVDLSDINQTNVLDASLKVSAQNEIPLDAFIQIYMLDAAYKVKDSLFSTNQTYLVKASTVNVSGDLAQPGVTSLELSITPSRLTTLFSSKYLLVRSMMSTARDENDALLNVKFRSAYRLRLHIGLLAKLNIQVK